MSDGQLTIWGGSTATGIPTTRPVRQPRRTSQGAVVIPLFRKFDRSRDVPTTAVVGTASVSPTPGADAPISSGPASPKRLTGDGPGAPPTRPGR